ncbi:MAG: protein TolR [Desulfomonile tiedjei]|uniref:Protein TolR n=1 Tax=Desulfomonile tiedjei TaxID=2358 RepID=A0A9D6Z268_9BACT|nr:protein TolR [Desulfomonile tiedjei]
MAFSTNSGNKTAMSEINVTPLVDVMLVLLIIFMVTAPMMQEGVSVDLPQAKGAPLVKEQHVEDIVISVSGPGNIFVNDVQVQEDKLAERIIEATKDRTSRDVYLRADKSVPYGVVVRIMGSLKSAGITNLGIITTAQEDSAKAK